MPGVYATGWIKRGPVGLIGHTKSDAMETIKHLHQRLRQLVAPRVAVARSAVIELLDARGIEYTDLDGWHRLDEHEMALGAAAGPRARQGRAPRRDGRHLGAARRRAGLRRSAARPSASARRIACRRTACPLALSRPCLAWQRPRLAWRHGGFTG